MGNSDEGEKTNFEKYYLSIKQVDIGIEHRLSLGRDEIIFVNFFREGFFREGENKGNLVVLGDFGLWLFDRAFIPNKGRTAAREEWCLSAERDSTQKAYIHEEFLHGVKRKVNENLLHVMDAFDEICRRLGSEE